MQLKNRAVILVLSGILSISSAVAADDFFIPPPPGLAKTEIPKSIGLPEILKIPDSINVFQVVKISPEISASMPVSLASPKIRENMNETNALSSPFQDKKLSECKYQNNSEIYSYKGEDKKLKAIFSGRKIKTDENGGVFYKVESAASRKFKNSVSKAIRKYEQVVNLRFVQTQDSCRSQIYFTEFVKGKKMLEEVPLINDGDGAGQISEVNGRYYIVINSPSKSSLPESLMVGTILHEIGHAVGLKHSGQYQLGDSGPYLDTHEDSSENTVMSYHVRKISDEFELGVLDRKALKLMFDRSGFSPVITFNTKPD